MKPFRNIERDESGFSMLELLIILIIIGVLAGIAIPGFSVMIPNYRLKSAAQDLFSNFQLAKVSAIRNNSFCSVTFGQQIDGKTYDYVVYLDNNKNLEYNAGEKVLVQRNLSDYKGVIFDAGEGGADFNTNDDALPSIAFRSNGLTQTNSGGFGAGTAHLINPRGRTTSVVIGPAGNIRMGS